MNKTTLLERLESKTNKTNTCWEWRGALNSKGYGAISIDGKPQLATRVIYSLLVDDNIHGKLILHHCDNPKCVRPEHLYAGTYSDNAQDREDRGRGKGCVIINRNKTHCPKGHPYDEKNTGYTKEGKRKCQKCRVQYTNEYRRRKRLGLTMTREQYINKGKAHSQGGLQAESPKETS